MTANSLQAKIEEMFKNDDEEIVVSEVSTYFPNNLFVQYDNLILDELNIERLTEDDCKYLATYTSLDRLCMNQTHLKSLANFPENDKLVRLELAENQIPGAEL
jgi:hypothetical protein